MSRVTAIISALLSASSSACHGLLIITVDNAITSIAQRDKNARELKPLFAAITGMQTRQRGCCCADAKYTKELADAKAENDALRDDAAAGRRRLHEQAVCQSVYIIASAWIMQSSPDLAMQTPLNGTVSPQREVDHYAKTTGRTQKYINEQSRVAHIDGQLMQLL